MKKLILYFGSAVLVVLLIILVITFTSSNNALTSGIKENANSTADHDSPEALYKHDKSIDLLIYKETAYVNAAKLDWVAELELERNEKLGEIERTGVKRKFKNFDATILETGIEIYSAIGREDFVLVEIDNKMLPYYAYVEG